MNKGTVYSCNTSPHLQRLWGIYHMNTIASNENQSLWRISIKYMPIEQGFQDFEMLPKYLSLSDHGIFLCFLFLYNQNEKHYYDLNIYWIWDPRRLHFNWSAGYSWKYFCNQSFLSILAYSMPSSFYYAAFLDTNL